MLKLKTRKSVAKRVKITKKGKVKAPRAFKGHLLSSKNRKRKRKLKNKRVFSSHEAAKVRAMMPYKV